MRESEARLKKDQALTPACFHLFLQWLDDGKDSSGERYLEMRRRLVGYFDRKGCDSPDDLADETLNRVALRLEETGKITDMPATQYCYVMAKFVFLEHLREAKRIAGSIEDLPVSREPITKPAVLDGVPTEYEVGEQLLACLEECLTKLVGKDRELIVDYYQGEQRLKIERRRQIAETLGLTANALSIRACRIRDKLESCVRTCSTKGNERF